VRERCALGKKEDQRWKGAFEDCKRFEAECEEKEIVVTKMDATVLHSSQEKGQKKLTVRRDVFCQGAGKP